MPQYKNHDFLRILPAQHAAYEFVFALVAIREGVSYYLGTACLIAPGFLVTAKHLLEFAYKNVAGLKTDETSPEVKESLKGPNYNLLPEHGVGIDAVQILPDRSTQRYAVTGYIEIYYKYTDLMVLQIIPHPGYPGPDKIEWKARTLDLVPPQVGRSVHGYGFPDHPEHPVITPDPWLQDYFLYQSLGDVEAVNLEPNLRNYQTSMKTASGMSGGPVFVSRNGKDHFCGIVSRGGFVDWSFVAPLWQIAWASTDALRGLPDRDGRLLFVDLMHQNIIRSIGSEHLSINGGSKLDLTVSFDDVSLLRTGY
jgi:hypothetical protein